MENITNSQGTFRFAEISCNSMDIFQLGKLINRLDRCGLFICRQGQITLANDQKEYILLRGGIFIYMPSAMLRPVTMSEDAEGLMVSVDIDYIIQVINKVSNIENVLYLRDYPYTMLPEDQFQQSLQIIQLMWQKTDEIAKGQYVGLKYTLANEIIKSMGQVAIYQILDAFFDKRPSVGDIQKMAEHSKRDLIFFKFLISLYKNYKSERDVAFYAEEQNLSSRYFSSIIKEKSGHSALQWIVNVVIGNIKQSLEGTDLSIKEIAMNLNFPTQSFFGKYFKQYVGVSPKEYRERMRGTSKKVKA